MATPSREMIPEIATRLLNLNDIKGEDKMEKYIEIAFADDKVKDGTLVDKHFGGGRNKDFLHSLMFMAYKKEILIEAKRLEAADKD